MGAKNFLQILILYGIISAVISSLPARNLNESSIFHVHKKRVINISSIRSRPARLDQVPYIVSIHENGILSCAGSILSPTVIITAAHCIEGRAQHNVWSNTINGVSGIRHRIKEIIKYPEFSSHRLSNDLALLQIDPPINWNTSFNRRIRLFNGTIPRNAHGIISGWGCNSVRKLRSRQAKLLQSITVPIIEEAKCRDIYKYFQTITNKEICTLDVNEEKGCTHGDSGGPLTIDGHLLGIVAWSRREFSLQNPDVSMNLLHPMYRNWIHAKVLLVD